MKKFALLYIIVLLFSSCAIRVNPTGGDKDVLPPKVLHTVPENFSVNVKTHDIVLFFVPAAGTAARAMTVHATTRKQ